VPITSLESFSCAPLTASPCLSVTVPWIVEVVCECATGKQITRAAAANSSARQALRQILKFPIAFRRMDSAVMDVPLGSFATVCPVRAHCLCEQPAGETFVAFRFLGA